MPSSQWRRYDKMRRFPDGLLVCGDAMCSFNPIYGQGMSVAALDAMALRECLRGGVTDVRRRYFRATAKSIGVAWQIAAVLTSLSRKWKGAGHRHAHDEPAGGLGAGRLQRPMPWSAAVLRVTALVDAPTRLLHPAFLYRVAAVNLRRRQRRSHAGQAVVGDADAGYARTL